MTGTAATRILAEDGRVQGVETAAGKIDADAVVIAAGTETRALLKPFGVRSYIYPLKGYSVTLPAPEGNAPEVSITDEARKIVVSRLGNRIRAAGQAEVGGYDLTLEPGRARSVLNALEGVLPQMGPVRDEAEFWWAAPDDAGREPRDRRNTGRIESFVNSGHGTLGWTLGAQQRGRDGGSGLRQCAAT